MAFLATAILIPTLVLASIALISTVFYLRQQNFNFSHQVYQLTTTTTERYKITEATENVAKNFVPLIQCNCQTLPNCPYFKNSGMILDINRVQKCGFDTSTFSIQICCPADIRKPPVIPEPRPTQSQQAQQSHSPSPVQYPVTQLTSSSTTKYNVIETVEEDYPIPDIDIRTWKPKNQTSIYLNELIENERNATTTTEGSSEDVAIEPDEDQQLDDLESMAMLMQLVRNSNLSLHENFKLLPQSTEECGNSKNLPLVDIKKKRRKKRVVGGRKTSVEKYPWIVKLYYRNTNRCAAEMCFGCLGTVINNKYILTTAHCAQISMNPMTIIAGDGETTKIFTVENIVSHPDYDNLTKHHDIALIRIRENIIFGEIPKLPVCLPFFEAYKLNSENELSNSKNNELLVAGWGISNSSDTSTIGTELRDAVVPEWPISACQNMYTKHNRNKTITYRQFCTGADKKTNADACWGDSGGGIYSLQSMIQVGIVSYGFPSPFKCGNFPGVNTRVIFYLKWILDSISP